MFTANKENKELTSKDNKYITKDRESVKSIGGLKEVLKSSSTNENNLKDKDREINKFEIMRKLEAKLNTPIGDPGVISNNAKGSKKNQGSLLSKTREYSPNTQDRKISQNALCEEILESKSSNLGKRIAKLK